MNPTNIRFELVQLQFHTKNTGVSNILQQITVSATEESLRTQMFGVCNTEGVEYDNDKALSDNLDATSSIVVAFPETNSGGSQKADTMAKPILRNSMIEQLFKISEFVFGNKSMKEQVQ